MKYSTMEFSIVRIKGVRSLLLLFFAAFTTCCFSVPNLFCAGFRSFVGCSASVSPQKNVCCDMPTGFGEVFRTPSLYGKCHGFCHVATKTFKSGYLGRVIGRFVRHPHLYFNVMRHHYRGVRQLERPVQCQLKNAVATSLPCKLQVQYAPQNRQKNVGLVLLI